MLPYVFLQYKIKAPGAGFEPASQPRQGRMIDRATPARLAVQTTIHTLHLKMFWMFAITLKSL